VQAVMLSRSSTRSSTPIVKHNDKVPTCPLPALPEACYHGGMSPKTLAIVSLYFTIFLLSVPGIAAILLTDGYARASAAILLVGAIVGVVRKAYATAIGSLPDSDGNTGSKATKLGGSGADSTLKTNPPTPPASPFRGVVIGVLAMCLSLSFVAANCNLREANAIENAVFNEAQTACLAINAPALVTQTNAVVLFEQACTLAPSLDPSINAFINSFIAQLPAATRNEILPRLSAERREAVGKLLVRAGK
jgi:hypothetical protein